VQALLHRVTALLYVVPLPVGNPSCECAWLVLGFLPGNKVL